MHVRFPCSPWGLTGEPLACQGCCNHLNIICRDSPSTFLHLFLNVKMNAVIVIMINYFDLRVSYWPQIISLWYIISIIIIIFNNSKSYWPDNALQRSWDHLWAQEEPAIRDCLLMKFGRGFYVYNLSAELHSSLRAVNVSNEGQGSRHG